MQWERDQHAEPAVQPRFPWQWGGEKDTVVIKHLIDRVFMKFFHEADPKLMELGTETAFVYTSCVLFPETFIHQHQVGG